MIIYHNLPPKSVEDMSLNASTMESLGDILKMYAEYPNIREVYPIGAEEFMVYGKEIAAAILANLGEVDHRRERAIMFADQLILKELVHVDSALLTFYRDGTIIGADREEEAAEFKAIAEDFKKF